MPAAGTNGKLTIAEKGYVWGDDTVVGDVDLDADADISSDADADADSADKAAQAQKKGKEKLDLTLWDRQTDAL